MVRDIYTYVGRCEDRFVKKLLDFGNRLSNFSTRKTRTLMNVIGGILYFQNRMSGALSIISKHSILM